MKILLSTHARTRLLERIVSMSSIKETIKNPDYERQAFDGRTVVRKSFGGKVLEIVLARHGDKVVVVTFYYI